MGSWQLQRHDRWTRAVLVGLWIAATAASGAGAAGGDDGALAARCERLDAQRDPDAADAWETLARRRGGDSYALWRAARAHHRRGEMLPLSAHRARLAHYERALAVARRGRQLDPQCGECCLYEFAALGRMISIEGFGSSVVHLREMSELVDRCLATPPTHADSERNQEHANLWYGLAAYYRAVPDSRWLELLTGARGDPARAVAYVERAARAAPDRIDYRVELGASLLCLAERRRDPGARLRGAATLRAATAMPTRHRIDEIDRRHAALLLERPDEACSYSRDRWPVDTEVVAGGALSVSTREGRAP